MAAADQPVKRVTIVGGGTAGWMTAAVLSKWLSKVEIKLVESDEIGIIGVGEATIPHIRNYLALAGVDVQKFIAATKATFKLGIDFVGWGAPGERYFHGFGKIGRDMLWLHTHQLWLAARARSPNSVKSFDRYAVNCVAALDNKMAFPDPRNPSSPIADIDYAYHFDASLFSRFLRGECEARGVTRIEGRIVEVIKDQESAFVTAVRLTDGREVEGDLFIDCSGMRALLIGDALGIGYEHWNKWLICDRALAMPCESVSPLTPYTRCTTRSAGWQWRIPLQHRFGNGYVYSSNHISDEQAVETLRANLDGEALADPRPVRFAPGRREKAWEKNVIAIGLSSGFLEPLESTSIHLIQTAIHRLLAMFPARSFSEADIAEFNRQARFEMEDVRDFIIAHYNVTRREGEPFWDYVRTMDVPDTLKERYELFRSSGRWFKHGAAELFSENSWVQVLIGQGFEARPDPVSEFVPTEEIANFLGDIEEVIADVVKEMPDHQQFIDQLLQTEQKQSSASLAPIAFTLSYERGVSIA